MSSNHLTSRALPIKLPLAWDMVSRHLRDKTTCSVSVESSFHILTLFFYFSVYFVVDCYVCLISKARLSLGVNVIFQSVNTSERTCSISTRQTVLQVFYSCCFFWRRYFYFIKNWSDHVKVAGTSCNLKLGMNSTLHVQKLIKSVYNLDR